MSFLRVILVAFFIYSNLHGQVIYTSLDFNKDFKKYETINFDFETLFEKVDQFENVNYTLDIKSYGKFDLQLSRSNLMFNNTEVFLMQNNEKHSINLPGNNQWKGNIKGGDKMVRLNIYRNCLNGFIETESGNIFIETFIINGTTGLVVYYASDVNTNRIGSFCARTGSDTLVMKPSTKRSESYERYSCAILKMGAVGAYRLFRKNKYDTIATFNEIKDIINISDGPFSKYVGVRLKIAFMSISLDSNSDLNTSNSTLGRLEDFTLKKGKFEGKLLPDIYHLFSENYTPDDNAIGMAYVSGLCRPDLNTSVSMQYGNLQYRALVLAHELGNNFNANHSHGSGCAGSSGSIMCPGSGSPSLLFFNSVEIDVMKQCIAGRKSDPYITKHCLEYPISNIIPDIDLYKKDSVLIKFNDEVDFKASTLWYEGKNILDVRNRTSAWVKYEGHYALKYVTDTLNGLLCAHDDEFFAGRRNFIVTNANVNGRGSISNAIWNSNVTKGMDTIIFQLPDSVHIIDIDSLVTPVVDSCFINGMSQKGYKSAQYGKVYDPSVTFRSKLPNNSDRICFNLIREKYTIKGLKFEDFYYAIYSNLNHFNYKEDNQWFPKFTDSNYKAEYDVKGNKFVNNSEAMYFNLYEINHGTDEVIIGGDSITDANFFLYRNGESIHLAYSRSSEIRGNYFGAEPGIDTAGKVNYGFSLNGCANTRISNNAIASSVYYGIILSNTSGYIKNNAIGIHPFTKNVIGFSGIGIDVSGFGPSDSFLVIGGKGVNDGNVLVGQRKNDVSNSSNIRCGDCKSTNIVGNRIISPDTTSIIINNQNVPKPLKALTLDSISVDCQNNNTLFLRGTVTPNIKNDTMELNFYSVPPGVKKGKEPMDIYLGSIKLNTPDTFKNVFTFSMRNFNSNEGIVFTATSKKRRLTSYTSNAIYPAAGLNIFPADLRDTSLCPNTTVKGEFKQSLNSYQMNGVNVVAKFEITKPGTYEMVASDLNNCNYRQTNNINYYPNFLSSSSISGVDSFKLKNNYSFMLSNNIYSKYWNNYLWSGQNDTIKANTKLSAFVSFAKDSAVLNYQITDINKCKCSISKKMTLIKEVVDPGTNNNIVLKNNLIIYPNPDVTDLLNFSLPVTGSIKVYNSLGQVALSFNETGSKVRNIDLGSLSKGVYFIWIASYGTFKVMKD